MADFNDYSWDGEGYPTGLTDYWGPDVYLADGTSGGETPPSDAESGGSGSGTETSGGSIEGGDMGLLPSASITDALNKMFGTSFTPKQFAGLAGVMGGGIAGIAGLNKPNMVKGNVGYQGTIPQLQANRNMMTAPPAGRRPGSGGVNYGGDVVYSPKGTSAPAPGGSYTPSELPVGFWNDMPDIQNASGILKAFQGGVQPQGDVDKSKLFNGGADEPNAFKGKFSPTYDPSLAMDYTPADHARDTYLRSLNPTFNANKAADMAQMANQAAAQNQQVKAAQGGLMGLAHGGRYLQGQTDGMADKLRTSIDGKQPAALSHGEFVIPADVVSHLGNGNSDAGAKKLYSMMDKIRQARTGTKKQGKQINPDKFMPGGLAQLAQGGAVQRFADGGVPAGTMGTEQTLAGWTGDYVPNMLAQGQALANAPYQQYQGPLTAGASGLQNQAFNTASNLTTPTSIGTAATTAGNIANKAQNLNYTPTTSTFDAGAAQQYMNPYLQASLNPQLEEARRQSEITAQQNNAQMTKAGAFGGGRQAILTAENQRNLGTNLAGITGQGYNTAYQNAMSQFNADQARKMQESQFGANYGLQGLQTGLQAAQAQGSLGATQNQTELANLNAQAGLGAQQRGIESEGIAADKKAFEEARDNPYKMLQFQQSLLNGLPISAQNYQQAGTSDLQNVAGGMTTVDKLLSTLGLSPAQTGAVPTAATGK
jgi:hypothetical protein